MSDEEIKFGLHVSKNGNNDLEREFSLKSNLKVYMEDRQEQPFLPSWGDLIHRSVV